MAVLFIGALFARPRSVRLRALRVTPMILALGGAVACTEHVGRGAGVGAELGVAPSSEAQLVRGLTIAEVAIFQGTRVSLEKAGAKQATRPMPVVAGRDALVRVYVTPELAQATRYAAPVTAELTLVRGGAITDTLRSTLRVVGASSEETPGTTFNFDVPGADIAADTRFMVRLLDDASPPTSTAEPNDAQYPRDGTTDALDAVKVMDALRVVIVPVRYLGDGSGRLPDTSPEVVLALRRRMLEFYPVPDVEVTVRAPIDHDGVIGTTGVGWDAVLQRVTQTRLADNPPADVFYYGAFAPMPTIGEFCAQSCVLGLSNFGEVATDAGSHASVGALYPANEAIDTMPHEIGHAFGRMHAPCGGASAPDPSYPHEGAHTGSWGYSVVTKTLKPPTAFDQMSYCTPSWQSDYTYAGIFARLRAVAGAAPTATPSTSTTRAYRILSVGADGSLSWSGPAFRSSVALSGPAQPLSWIDREGKATIVTGHAYGYDHLEGGYVIVPEPEDGNVARLAVDTASPDAARHAMWRAVASKHGARAEIER